MEERIIEKVLSFTKLTVKITRSEMITTSSLQEEIAHI